MTLMEAVVALLILSLAAVGCLELAQGASQLEFNATEWNAAVSVAESRMAQLTTGAPGTPGIAAPQVTRADAARLDSTITTREPWRTGLDVVSVSVPVTGGKRYVLRKLVPSTPQRTASALP